MKKKMERKYQTQQGETTNLILKISKDDQQSGLIHTYIHIYVTELNFLDR